MVIKYVVVAVAVVVLYWYDIFVLKWHGSGQNNWALNFKIVLDLYALTSVKRFPLV